MEDGPYYQLGKLKYSKPLEPGSIIYRNGKTKEIVADDNDSTFKPGFYNMLQSFLQLIKNEKNKWPDVNLNSLDKTYELIKNSLEQIIRIIMNILIVAGNIGYRHSQKVHKINEVENIYFLM